MVDWKYHFEKTKRKVIAEDIAAALGLVTDFGGRQETLKLV